MVTVADGFTQNTYYSWQQRGLDTPFGNQLSYTDLVMEYEQLDIDPLVDAYKTLQEYMSENHPDKDYRVYYWTLEFI